jgi:tRNA-splicing ligase RtcB
MHQIYDVAHNIAKIEEHFVDGKVETLCVHRKGATRAFPPRHCDVPKIYQETGQPVLIPGDMGRASYIAVGSDTALSETFGSTCHGAGRMQSRGAAKRNMRGNDIARHLADRGIMVKTDDIAALAEEASEAYKDIKQVIEIAHRSGISKKAIMAAPLGVIKG